MQVVVSNISIAFQQGMAQEVSSRPSTYPGVGPGW